MSDSELSQLDDYLHLKIAALNINASLIKEAIEYTLFSGGKRIRPLLCYHSAPILNVSLPVVHVIAGAIELVHCYSLIHDDLPAMDNDDYRRGRPSCHKAFDEATAILAGDAMQALAFELLVTDLPKYLPNDKVIKICQNLAKACGPEGMISGQSLDLTQLTNPSLTETQLIDIHQLKTGRLFTTCMNMMIEASSQTGITSGALVEFIDILGLVFQMQDDYLDAYDPIDGLGKNRGSDAANGKRTFTYFYDQTNLLNQINQKYSECLTLVAPLANNQKLTELIQTLQQRTDREKS